MKRGDVTYAGLAALLAKHGLKGGAADSIKSKPARGSFAATFLLVTLCNS